MKVARLLNRCAASELLNVSRAGEGRPRRTKIFVAALNYSYAQYFSSIPHTRYKYYCNIMLQILERRKVMTMLQALAHFKYLIYVQVRVHRNIDRLIDLHRGL